MDKSGIILKEQKSYVGFVFTSCKYCCKCLDFDKPPENSDMSLEFRKQLGACSTGSVALIFIDKGK